MSIEIPPLLQDLFQEAKKLQKGWYNFKVSEVPSGQKLLKLSAEERWPYLKTCFLLEVSSGHREIWGYPEKCRQSLVRKTFAIPVSEAQDLLEKMESFLPAAHYLASHFLAALNFLEKTTDLQHPALHPVLHKLQGHFAEHPYADGQKVSQTLTRLLARPDELVLDMDVWGTWASHDLQNMPEPQAWKALLHALSFEGQQPDTTWFSKAQKTIQDFGTDRFIHQSITWLGLLKKQSPQQPTEQTSASLKLMGNNQTTLRKLLFAVRTLEHPSLMGALAEAAIQCFKKIPGVGPRSPMLGLLAMRTLSCGRPLKVAPHLERIRQTIKQPSYLQELEQLFKDVATRAGLTVEQLADFTVPTFGLQAGQKTFDFDTHHAVLSVQHFEGRLEWFTREGKPIKSVPAAVKNQHKLALQDIKAELEDLNRFLSVYRNRIEGFYLEQWKQKQPEFEQHQLHHPLLEHICQKLIWQVGEQAVFWWQGHWVNASNKAVEVDPAVPITLWHPALDTLEHVQAWRNFMLEHSITQPFKQAHREVYLLTAAEERTHSYSNRFAAHILKQHQFHALCGQRGWKNTLRLMVDDAYTAPHRLLSQWNLRAEFWVEGIGNNDETDTTPSGSYLYLNTDQVRFYRLEDPHNYAHASGGGYAQYWRNRQSAEPVPLQDIPPLVFSEIMRDVDLFVGVCSVGNDPNWTDGGAHAHHQNYWQNYSFGELNATAETRKDLLSRLIPRLKIRDQASIDGRFLKVVGQRKTYKIHLGSGNILMEPNDQYLCIVPDSSMGSASKGVFLPFEGDRTLAIILSKAFLLAEDHKITDPTITRQL